MKKRTLIFILLTLVSMGAFEQFAVEGSYGVPGGSTLIGVRYDLSGLDIMAAVGLNFRQNKYESENSSASDYSYWNHSVGIFTGIAPKVVFSDNWTLSFPLLAAIGFGGRSKYAASGSSNAGNSTFSLMFIAGGRVSFFFTEHFSLYFGFLIPAVSWEQTKVNTWTGSPGGETKVDRTTRNLYILSSGTIPIGVSYRF